MAVNLYAEYNFETLFDQYISTYKNAPYHVAGYLPNQISKESALLQRKTILRNHFEVTSMLKKSFTYDNISIYEDNNFCDYDKFYAFLIQIESTYIETQEANIKLEKANEERDAIFSDFMHTVGNSIAPRILCDTAKSIIENDTIDKSQIYHVLMNAFINEDYLIELKNLKTLEYKDDIKIREAIRREFKDQSDSGITINQIIHDTIKRIFSYALFDKKGKVLALKKYLGIETRGELLKLRDNFIKEVLFSSENAIFKWIEKFLPAMILNIDPAWNQINFVSGGYLYTIMTEHFQELMLNAVKYRDYDSEYLAKIDFSSEIINQHYFYTLSFINQKPERESNFESGLYLIGKLLKKLNGDILEKYHIIESTKDTFRVKLFYSSELFKESV